MVFESISNQHSIMGSSHYEGGSDLESTLGIIDRIFSDLDDSEPMPWHKFSFSVPHHAWMGHILLHCAWDALRKDLPLPGYTREFVHHSLQLVPPPPAPIIADCLFIIGLVLDIRLCTDDLFVVDKR